MVLHGALGEVEANGDLAVAETLGHQPQHLPFPRGQPLRGGGQRRHAAERLGNLIDQTGTGGSPVGLFPALDEPGCPRRRELGDQPREENLGRNEKYGPQWSDANGMQPGIQSEQEGEEAGDGKEPGS